MKNTGKNIGSNTYVKSPHNSVKSKQKAKNDGGNDIKYKVQLNDY
jgi:hypothetical protein